MKVWRQVAFLTAAALSASPAAAQSPAAAVPFNGSLSVMTCNVKGAPWFAPRPFEMAALGALVAVPAW